MSLKRKALRGVPQARGMHGLVGRCFSQLKKSTPGWAFGHKKRNFED